MQRSGQEGKEEPEAITSWPPSWSAKSAWRRGLNLGVAVELEIAFR